MSYISELNITFSGKTLQELCPGCFVHEFDPGEFAFDNETSQYYNEGVVVSHLKEPSEVIVSIYVPGEYKSVLRSYTWTSKVEQLVAALQGSDPYISYNGFKAYGKLTSVVCDESVTRGRLRLYTFTFTNPSGYWRYTSISKVEPGISGAMLYFNSPTSLAFPQGVGKVFSMRSRSQIYIDEKFTDLRALNLHVDYSGEDTYTGFKVIINKYSGDSVSTIEFTSTSTLDPFTSVWVDINMKSYSGMIKGGVMFPSYTHFTDIVSGDNLVIECKAISGGVTTDITTQCDIKVSYEPLYSFPDLGSIKEV